MIDKQVDNEKKSRKVVNNKKKINKAQAVITCSTIDCGAYTINMLYTEYNMFAKMLI